MLVEPKYVWEAVVWLKNYKQITKKCKQTAEKCKQTFENGRNLQSIKRILGLPI